MTDRIQKIINKHEFDAGQELASRIISTANDLVKEAAYERLEGWTESSIPNNVTGYVIQAYENINNDYRADSKVVAVNALRLMKKDFEDQVGDMIDILTIKAFEEAIK